MSLRELSSVDISLILGTWFQAAKTKRPEITCIDYETFKEATGRKKTGPVALLKAIDGVEGYRDPDRKCIEKLATALLASGPHDGLEKKSGEYPWEKKMKCVFDKLSLRHGEESHTHLLCCSYQSMEQWDIEVKYRSVVGLCTVVVDGTALIDSFPSERLRSDKEEKIAKSFKTAKAEIVEKVQEILLSVVQNEDSAKWLESIRSDLSEESFRALIEKCNERVGNSKFGDTPDELAAKSKSFMYHCLVASQCDKAHLFASQLMKQEAFADAVDVDDVGREDEEQRLEGVGAGVLPGEPRVVVGGGGAETLETAGANDNVGDGLVARGSGGNGDKKKKKVVGNGVVARGGGGNGDKKKKKVVGGGVVARGSGGNGDKKKKKKSNNLNGVRTGPAKATAKDQTSLVEPNKKGLWFPIFVLVATGLALTGCWSGGILLRILVGFCYFAAVVFAWMLTWD